MFENEGRIVVSVLLNNTADCMISYVWQVHIVATVDLTKRGGIGGCYLLKWVRGRVVLFCFCSCSSGCRWSFLCITPFLGLHDEKLGIRFPSSTTLSVVYAS